MKTRHLAWLASICIASVSACSSTGGSGESANESSETETAAVRTAARAAVMHVASTPVKVAAGAGTVAHKLEEKLAGDQESSADDGS